MALVAVLAGLVILATVSDGQQYARPPLFTSEDLGPVPSAAENGFEEFMDGFKSAGLLEPPVGGRRQWPAVLTDALSWLDVREKAVEIRKAASLDHVARVSAVLDHATRKPHFVHGSPKHDAMPFHWAHEALRVTLVSRALDGKWDDVWDSVERLLRADRSFVTSVQNEFALRVAMSTTRQTLRLVTLLMERYTEAASDPARPSIKNFPAVAAELRRLSTTTIDPTRGILAKYLACRQELDSYQKEAVECDPLYSSTALGALRRELFPFERSNLRRRLDDATMATMALVAHPSTARQNLLSDHRDSLSALWVPPIAFRDLGLQRHLLKYSTSSTAKVRDVARDVASKASDLSVQIERLGS